MMRTLYLIPARGGSTGLPGKNIRPLLGKPLIAWTIATAIEAAKRSHGRVVVSTDDEVIARIAREHGADVPFMRPAELATDSATSVDVVLHALDFFADKGGEFELVCMLEATSPQREANDIIGAMELLMKTEGAESIVGVCRSESGHPSFLAKKDARHFISPLNGGNFVFKRRQEVDDVWFFEGSLYLAHASSLRERKSFYHDRTLGYVMPKWKAFEVDDITDFTIIEALMKARQEGKIPEK